MRTYDPGILEGDHMVNVKLSGIRRGLCVVRADPAARLGDAGVVDYDVGAVALENKLAVVPSQLYLQIKSKLGKGSYRALQLPEMADQCGNKSRS